MSIPELFGIIPAGLPLLTSPSSAPSQTSFLYTLPTSKPFSHITVVFLPGITLPPDTAAAVYVALSSSPQNFKFLGGIGPGKESAVFKLNGAAGDVILGIDIEPAAQVAQQMDALAAQSQQANGGNGEGTMVLAKKNGEGNKDMVVVLAQRIIKNAFNFLASFSGNVPVSGSSGVSGVEVVPLKAFEDWWRKFETRIRTDPGFLERDVD